MSVSTMGFISPSRNYGVGALGAKLALPVVTVNATPSNLASLINSHAAGTNFALAAGSYVGTFPNKTGNGYYGDPDDHTAVVFDGQITYDKVTVGGLKTGGFETIFEGINSNTFANFTVEKYGAYLDRLGGSPWSDTGTGTLWQNLLIQDCQRSGLKVGGSANEIRFSTSRYNGRYCMNGGGTNNHFYNNHSYSSGDDNMETRGLTPRPGTGADPGGRGIGKYVQSTGVGHHECLYSDQQGAGGKGLWYDINNSDCLVEDNLFERIDRPAVDFELGHGGTIQRNVFRECNLRTGTPNWRAGTIHIATGGPTTIQDNDIENASQSTRTGIMLWQHNRDTQGDNQNPPFWSGLCGSIVRRNRIEGFHYPVAVTCSYTKDGCHFVNDPTAITIVTNNEIDFTEFYQNGDKTPVQWAAIPYD